MHRNNLIAWVLTAFFIALIPSVGAAQDVKISMSDIQAAAALLGAPKVQGNDLYFGPRRSLLT